MGFSTESLTKEFVDDIVLYEFTRSSGMGGPGCVQVITKDGHHYFFGAEGMMERNEDDFIEKYFPMFYESLSSEKVIDGWTTFIPKWYGRIFIKDELFEKLLEMDNNRMNAGEVAYGYHGGKSVWWVIDNVKAILDPEKKYAKRIDDDKTIVAQKKEHEYNKAYVKREAQIKLSEDDTKWYEYGYSGDSDPLGCYTLMFKKQDDGSIMGSMLTIAYQREAASVDGRSHRQGAPIVAYNLFYHKFDEIRGKLDVAAESLLALDYRRKQLTQTLDIDSLNIRDEFIASFPTLEKAKASAYDWARTRGGHTKENLIRQGERIDNREWEINDLKGFKRAKNIFINRFSEIMAIIDKQDYRGRWASEIAKELKIEEDDANRIFDFFDAHLCTKEYEDIVDERIAELRDAKG